MIVCARCGTPLEDDMRFCIECGRPVGRVPVRVSVTDGVQEAAGAGAGSAAQTAFVTAGRLGAPAAAEGLTRGGPVSPSAADATAAPGASSLLRPRHAVSLQPALHRTGGVPAMFMDSWCRMRWLKTLTVCAVLWVVGACIWFGLKQRPAASVRFSETKAAPAPPRTTAVEIPLSGGGSRADSLQSADGAVTELPPGVAGDGNQTLVASGGPPARGPEFPPVAPTPGSAPSPQSSARPQPATAAGEGAFAEGSSSLPGTNLPDPDGKLVWTGRLRPGTIVTIDGDRATTGTLRGALPGVPVIVETASPNVRLKETPGPANGWKRIAFEGLRDQSAVVTLHWRLF